MKKTLLLSAFCLGLFTTKATIHTISVSGTSFTPSTVNAVVGDTVAWVLSGIHTATEVSSTTWGMNGNTPIGGGFNFDQSHTAAMTSWIKVTAAGTRYFVCTPHASMGMKGQIVTTSGVGVTEQNNVISMNVYPNPANLVLNLNIAGAQNETASIDVYNLIGNKVLDLGGKQVLTNGVRKIDISALPRGVYFLNVIADNKSKAIRFVKE